MAKCDTTLGMEVDQEIKRRRHYREMRTNPQQPGAHVPGADSLRTKAPVRGLRLGNN